MSLLYDPALRKSRYEELKRKRDADRVARGLPPARPGRPVKLFTVVPPEGGNLLRLNTSDLRLHFPQKAARAIPFELDEHLEEMKDRPDLVESWYIEKRDLAGRMVIICRVQDEPKIFTVEAADGQA